MIFVNNNEKDTDISDINFWLNNRYKISIFKKTIREDFSQKDFSICKQFFVKNV